MNLAKKIAGLKPAKATWSQRKCTPKKLRDEELGFDVFMCAEDLPDFREPMKPKKKRKNASCKQYQWADTKMGRQCVCSATGKRAANRYCKLKKAR